jgi:hypothetical protein
MEGPSRTAMLDLLRNLDRRWIFLATFLAVGIPVVLQPTFPELPSQLVIDAFDAIEDLPEGSKVMITFDYDPSAEGELKPMATAFVRHCCLKKLKIYFLATWPLGPQMIDEQIQDTIQKEFPGMVYGEDYVNLGFREGREAVIRVVGTDLKRIFETDHRGTNLNRIPMTRDLRSVQDMDLLVAVSAGFPGTKEWIQYVCTPYNVNIVTGCTGVQAPLFYPYLPKPLVGMLGAIKGAAEYEQVLMDHYPQYKDPKQNDGIRRMGPQLVAHLLVISLIVVGNVIYFADRWTRRGAA